MAINEQNGRNVFDPSKRIRGKLGNDFIQEAENDAFDKLKLVASASGMRSTSENNSNENEENVNQLLDLIDETPASILIE